MQDPYKTLGVTPDASDDEIKKAYRNLAKKYHPDRNPGDKHAAEMMNEVNAAYDAIKNGTARQRSGYSSASGPYQYGYGTGGYGYQSYSPFTDYAYSQQSRQRSERSEYTAARNFIRNGLYAEALNCLDGMPRTERDARWYYLHAVANFYAGNRAQALNDAQMAADIEPDNPEYASLLEQLHSSGNAYTSYRTTRVGFNPLRAVGMMCLANMLCGPMCGMRFICC